MDEIVVHIPLGDMMHCDDPERSRRIYQRCLMNPTWWERRGELMRRYTMPALEAAKGVDVIVWATIRPETIRYAGPVLEQIGRVDGYVFPQNIDDVMLTHKQDVVVAHLDSDDIYGPHALRHMLDACRSEGDVALLRDGYYLDTATGIMAEVTMSGPPFFAKRWTKKSLSSRRDYDTYRANWHMPFHHQMPRCPHAKVIEGRHYVQTIHGSNTSSAWTNLHTKNKITRMIESLDEAAATYARFLEGSDAAQ